MKKNIKKLFLAAGLLAMTGALLTGCGSKKKNAEEESVIKISTAPEPTATPDPKTVDPDAVTSNGNLTMVNEYLAENGSEALGIDGVTPTPAASDGSTDNADSAVKIQAPMRIMIHQVVVERKEPWMENEAKKPLELYIHIPFCVKKCDYCDFLSGPAGKERQRGIFPGFGKGDCRCSGFFGQGDHHSFYRRRNTIPCRIPTLVGEDAGQIRNKFFVAPWMLRSPSKQIRGHLYKEKLPDISGTRDQPTESGASVPAESGIKDPWKDPYVGRVSGELFYGKGCRLFQHQYRSDECHSGTDLCRLGKNLRTVAGLSPEHISAYSLIIEEGTPFGERKLKLPDEDTEYRMYENTAGILAEYGFHQYEISNYAKGGRECRHNKGYWQRIDYLGLGLGASSLLDHMRFSNTADMKEYIGNSAFPDKIQPEYGKPYRGR